MAEQTPNPESSDSPVEDRALSAPEGGAEARPSDGRASSEPTPEEAIDAAERAAADIKRETDEPASSGDADAGSPQHNTGGAPTGPDGKPLTLEDFSNGQDGSGDRSAGLNLLNDIDLQVTVELGRTRMYIEDVLRLNENSVVELDKAAGDSVDIFVNDRLVARGEVLVLNENFCVRINEILSQTAIDEAEEVSRNDHNSMNGTAGKH